MTISITALVMVRPNHGHAGELTLSTCHGSKRHALHTGHFGQLLLQFVKTSQISLANRFWRKGMTGEKPRNAGCPMRPSRVVFHGARTKGIKLLVNRKILSR